MNSRNIAYSYIQTTTFIKFQHANVEENKKHSNGSLIVCPEGDIGPVLPIARIETLAYKNLHQKRRGKEFFHLLQPPDGEQWCPIL